MSTCRGCCHPSVDINLKGLCSDCDPYPPELNDEDDVEPAPPKVLNPPDQIWLVYGELEHDDEHIMIEEVLWCEDQQFPSDVRYVRAEQAEARTAKDDDEELLLVLWREYGEADPATLTPGAQAWRLSLRTIIAEANGAPPARIEDRIAAVRDLLSVQSDPQSRDAADRLTKWLEKNAAPAQQP